MIVVVPPAMALRDPEVKSSPVGLLSCARWTCESTPPAYGLNFLCPKMQYSGFANAWSWLHWMLYLV